jgi:hypothetical protein
MEHLVRCAGMVNARLMAPAPITLRFGKSADYALHAGSKTAFIVYAGLIQSRSDVGELLVPLNGRCPAGPEVCQSFLERVKRMWIVVTHAKFGLLTKPDLLTKPALLTKVGQLIGRMMHRGSRTKAEPTRLCGASARA